MGRGLSFFEFNYMIMQAYDFLHLHNNYGCNMQFGGDDQWSNMPTTEISNLDISDEGMAIIDLMVMCKPASSKTEARRLIQQGGVSADGEKIDNIEKRITKDWLVNGVKIRRGKKNF